MIAAVPAHPSLPFQSPHNPAAIGLKKLCHPKISISCANICVFLAIVNGEEVDEAGKLFVVGYAQGLRIVEACWPVCTST